MPHMFSGKIDQIKQMFSCVSVSKKKKKIFENNKIKIDTLYLINFLTENKLTCHGPMGKFTVVLVTLFLKKCKL